VAAFKMIDPEARQLQWLWCLWLVEFNIVFCLLIGYHLPYMPMKILTHTVKLHDWWARILICLLVIEYHLSYTTMPMEISAHTVLKLHWWWASILIWHLNWIEADSSPQSETTLMSKHINLPVNWIPFAIYAHGVMLLQSLWLLHCCRWQMMAFVSNVNMQQQNTSGCSIGLFLNIGHWKWSITTSYTIGHTAGTPTYASSVTMTPFITTDKWRPHL
jgi:uncharacterized membrane protein (DUF485 family)